MISVITTAPGKAMLGVDVVVGVAVGVRVGVGVRVAVDVAVAVAVGPVVAEEVGVGVEVDVAVAVAGTLVPPGFGAGCAAQSAAVSVSCATGDRAKDDPADTAGQAGEKIVLSEP